MVGLALFALTLVASAYPVPSQHHGFVEFDLHKAEKRWSDSMKAFDSSQNKVVTTRLVNKEFYYQIQLGVGNPPQLLDFTIDTGSSDLWVMASTNPWCTSDPLNSTGIDCSGSVFNPNKSRTFKDLHEDFSIEYGDGTFANGTLVSDTIRIGGSSILNSTFAMADVGNSSTCVFGVGFIGNEANSHVHKNGSGVYPTYFNVPTMMKEQNLISTNAFSLWLNGKDAEQGSILFGGVDKAKYEGDLVVMPVYNNYHKYTEHPTQTRVMLNGIKFDGQPLAEFSIAVLLDSGTSYAYLPEPLVHSIGNALGFTYDAQLGYYFGGIDTAKGNVKNMQLNFSGVDIDVPVDDLLVELTLDDEITPLFINDQPQAILAVSAADNDYLYILGDVFLRSMYAVFDLDHYEIALAKAKVNVTQKDIVTIGASIPNAVQAPLYASTFPNNSSFSTYKFSPATPAPSTLSLDLVPTTLMLSSESISLPTPTGALSLGLPSAYGGSVSTRATFTSSPTSVPSGYWAPISISTSTVHPGSEVSPCLLCTAPAESQGIWNDPALVYTGETNGFFTLPSASLFTENANTNIPCPTEWYSQDSQGTRRVHGLNAGLPCNTEQSFTSFEDCYATPLPAPAYSDKPSLPSDCWEEDIWPTASIPCKQQSLSWPDNSLPSAWPLSPNHKPLYDIPPDNRPSDYPFGDTLPCQSSSERPPEYSPKYHPPPPPALPSPDHRVPPYLPPNQNHPGHHAPYHTPQNHDSEDDFDQYVQLPDGELVPKRGKRPKLNHGVVHNGWYADGFHGAPAQNVVGCPSCGGSAYWSVETSHCELCDSGRNNGKTENSPCGFFKKIFNPFCSH